MKVFIKNMVSIRCNLIVKSELEKLGIPYYNLKFGEVDIQETLSDKTHDQLNKVLHKSGLELLDDKQSILIEKIKNTIIEMIHYADELPTVKYSVYLSEKLNHNYTYLANVFSEVKGITIEHYIILHKIEKVKELIVYNELNLSEIARKLHYNNVGHLSAQFKKVTGLTPSFFKLINKHRRKAIDHL
jgi:YesN/AraC family two-component response regulator